MPTVIKVENLSKYYRLGLIGGKTLRDDLNRWWARVRKQPDPLLKIGQEDRQNGNGEYLWALRDINFEVQQGEIVGIIGRNGAGKSTLLKILSRITAPTSGQINVKGRVASLLEVGTGFHPELTGRENIYLNGAILGMKRAEIDRKFDEIVDFSGVEKFIDTPVKRYSSGMYVRLAFAVAAHLEPEILVLDEVLAVGDAAFQKKCLGKMGDVAKAGRTVLFVSHNMLAVQSLCKRVIWLNGGKIAKDGQVGAVVADYLQRSSGGAVSTEHVWKDMTIAPGSDIARLRRVCIRPESGTPTDPITMRTPLVIEMEIWNLLPNASLDFNFHLLTEHEQIAFADGSLIENGRPLTPGLYRGRCYIPGNLLNAGHYSVRVFIGKDNKYVVCDSPNALKFEVHDSSDRYDASYSRIPGAVRPLLKWATDELEQNNNISQFSERSEKLHVGQFKHTTKRPK